MKWGRKRVVERHCSFFRLYIFVRRSLNQVPIVPTGGGAPPLISTVTGHEPPFPASTFGQHGYVVTFFDDLYGGGRTCVFLSFSRGKMYVEKLAKIIDFGSQLGAWNFY